MPKTERKLGHLPQPLSLFARGVLGLVPIGLVHFHRTQVERFPRFCVCFPENTVGIAARDVPLRLQLIHSPLNCLVVPFIHDDHFLPGDKCVARPSLSTQCQRSRPILSPAELTSKSDGFP